MSSPTPACSRRPAGETLGLAGDTVDNTGGKIEATASSTVQLQGTTVTAGSAITTLGGVIEALAGGPSTLNLAALTNAGRIQADSGAALAIGATAKAAANSGVVEAVSGGVVTLAGAVANKGNLWANGGALTVGGAVTGTGAETISGGVLTLNGAVAATQTVTFAAGTSGALDLGHAQTFAGTVAGLAAGDTIDLQNFHFSGAPTISAVTGTGAVGTTVGVTIKDGAASATIHLLVQYAGQFATSASGYSLTSDNPGSPSTAGTLFQLAPPGG